MSDELGLAVISRVAHEDRIPFVKALAGLAAIDDEVTLDEKKAVMSFAKAWDLSDAAIGETRDILRQGDAISLSTLIAEFNQPNTPYLLLEELIRLSHADGTYGKAEQSEIRRIAESVGLGDALDDVEQFVERGLVWGSTEADDDGRDHDALQEVLNRKDDNGDYSLDDIPTADASDLDKLSGTHDAGDDEDE